MNFIYEEFDNINYLLSTLENRKNNSIMKNENSSNTGNYNFTRTNSYEEAVTMLRTGYKEVLPQIQSLIKKNNLIKYSNLKRKQQNMYVGFVPNVPNVLQNKPDSMINIISSYQKKKIKNIIYAIGANAMTSPDIFVRAGVALVSAINTLELSGISTRLLVGFMTAEKGNELVCSTLKIKDYGERFNIEKICFPLIHPSMFRRIGFKWLETCLNLTESGFSCGYGSSPKLDLLKENLVQDEATVVLNTSSIADMNFKVESILKEFGFVNE